MMKFETSGHLNTWIKIVSINYSQQTVLRFLEFSILWIFSWINLSLQEFFANYNKFNFFFSFVLHQVSPSYKNIYYQNVFTSVNQIPFSFIYHSQKSTRKWHNLNSISNKHLTQSFNLPTYIIIEKTKTIISSASNPNLLFKGHHNKFIKWKISPGTVSI